MKLRATVLLASSLFAAMALAAPAISSATTILDEEKELNDKEIPLKGTHTIGNKKVGSISCTQQVTLTVKNQTITIPKYELFTNTCMFTGRFAKCTISKYTPEGLAWKVDVDKNLTLTIKDMTVTLEFAGKDCPYVSMKFHYEPMAGVPDDPKKVTTFNFSGSPDVKLVPKETGYPVDLEGTELSVEGNGLTAFGMVGRCPGTTFDGELEEASASTAFVPTFNNSACTITNGESEFSSTVNPNGCTFVVNIGEGSEDSWSGTVDLVCPEGNSLEISVYMSPSEGIKICTLKLGGQEGLEGLAITNDTEGGDVVLHGTLAGVSVQKSGLCGAASTEAGAYDLELTGAGTGSEGGPEGISVQGGLLEAEEEGEEEGEGSGGGDVEEEAEGTYEIA
jgi:hypothetical protein